jgi:TELO2-interacting protein 1
VALKFRGQQASIKSLLQALEALHKVLVELSRLDALDEKLAEYVFFPLSNVFNASQRLSSRCLEIAVQCLQNLVSQGWRQKLQPEMGKQLLVLLSLLSGGSPARSMDNPPSEELICACFECMGVVFTALGQADKHIFDETGAKTIVDQNVYLLLEAITENPSDIVQLAATKALRTLLSQISSRVLLASLLPRTVSALTKALKPTIQIRRSIRVLVAILELLSHILEAVLANEVTSNSSASQSAIKDSQTQGTENGDESSILDEKWLKATSSQIKLALANVVKLRSHDRQEVRIALFKLCLMICEDCSKSLSDSLQLVIETMVVLAGREKPSPSQRELHTLKHLILSNAEFADSLCSSLNAWTNALPRVMQGADEQLKQQMLGQISAAVEILLEADQAPELLGDSLATSLVESVSAAVDTASSKPSQVIAEAQTSGQIISLQENAESKKFMPIILAQKSQSASMVELQSLIGRVRCSMMHESFSKSIMTRLGESSGSQQLSALWLSLNLLRQNDKPSFSLSDLINIPSESYDTTPYLISDLYSLTLPLLQDSTTSSPSNDWRLCALALESTILQANQLGKSYRPELIDTLYPILSLLGNAEPCLRSHAVTSLNLLATACHYSSTATMLVDNVDYLINSVALKLNSFDISPQGPQVLLMMLRLCGARLIPYLDDMIGNIFAALDNFHGYPRLVELLFDVLGVVVDEAAKNPTLAIASGTKEPKHRKTACRPSTMEDILADIRAHKRRAERRKAEMLADQVGQSAQQLAPQRPWTTELDGAQDLKQVPEAQEMDIEDDQQPSTSPGGEEKEQPLSKSHNLLLSIAHSTVPHLSSPAPRVRLILLQLLTRISPILAKHENSFLPLVNDVWPAILPRLFSLEQRSAAGGQQEEGGDPAFVNIAAANTISALCIGARDFMSSRVEGIFPHLERIYIKIWKEIEKDRQRTAQHRGAVGRLALDNRDRESKGANLRGTVDLRIVNSSPTATALDKKANTVSPNPRALTPSLSQSTTQSVPRTTTSQIHTALTHLLTTILTHVRVLDSIGEPILTLLSPIMDEPGQEHAREALEVWNADAVWVMRERMKIEREIRDGVREVGDWRWSGNGEKPGPVRVTREDGREEVWEFADVVF